MSIAAVPQGLGSLVSPLTGAVVTLDARLLEPDDALLHSAWCELPAGGTAGGLFQAGGGWSTAPARAAAAAAGEAIERLCAASLDEGRCTFATAAELGPEALDPRRIRLFLPQQLAGTPLVAPGPRTPLRWLRGVRLPDLAPAWLPAQFVELAPRAAGTAEPPITLATSNGLACGPDPWSALAGALLELVERDAFTLAWAGRHALPQLVWDGHAGLERFAAERLRPAGLDAAVIDLSCFLGVPAALSVVRPPGGRPGPTAVGAAAAATAAEAVQRALAEGHAAFSAARAYLRARPAARFADDGSDIASFDDRVLFYADPRRAAALAFLTASPERRHVDDVPPLAGAGPREQVTALCERIARAGGTAYAADLTAADAAAAGVHVVRAVCPELCPIDAVHALRFLGVPRLLTGARDAGLRPRALRLEEVNPDPHPFP